DALRKIRIRKPPGWNPTPPRTELSCAVCLWRMGFGYDRIRKRVGLSKKSVSTFIQLRVRKRGLSRPGLARWRPIKSEPAQKPKADLITRAAKRALNRNRRKTSIRFRRYVWQWLFRDYNSPLAEQMTGCSRE